MKAEPAFDPTLPERASKVASGATDAEIEEALAHAADFLGTLPWKGKKLNSSQGLSWPRSGVFVEGKLVTGVPEEIQKLNSLVTSFILAKIPFDLPALAWVMLHAEPFLLKGTELEDFTKRIN